MSWDLFCKALVKECASDFIAYFAPNARYVGIRETQLQTRVDDQGGSREIRGDIVLEAELVGTYFLVNVEWQSTRDAKMDERLLGYSHEITRVQGLNVLSCVIYTQPVGHIPRAPLERSIPLDRAPGRRPMIWFDFESLDLHNTLVEQLWACNLDAFFVLALLCQDGNTTATLERALERLLEHKDTRKEALATTIFFAGKVLKSEEDRKFLERKRDMLKDTLRDSWMYQKVLGEGREEGRVEEARKSIEIVTSARFPEMLTSIKNQIVSLTDEVQLQHILNVVALAQTIEEVQQALSTMRQSSAAKTE